MRLIHISVGGPTLRIIDRKYRLWRFEMHRYCGPAVVDHHGDPKDVQPPEASPFWEAVTCWAQQGKQLKDGDLCVWQKPTIAKMRHVGGRHYVLED